MFDRFGVVIGSGERNCEGGAGGGGEGVHQLARSQLTDGDGSRFDGIGVGEVVVIVDVGTGEDLSCDGGDVEIADDDLRGKRAIEMRVDDGQGEAFAVAFGSIGGGAAQTGEGRAYFDRADGAITAYRAGIYRERVLNGSG